MKTRKELKWKCFMINMTDKSLTFRIFQKFNKKGVLF